MILVADCVPILISDPSKGVIGAVHAGWKGTLEGIAQKTVEALQGLFGCSPEDLVVGIGPSIGPCCYEVGPEIVSRAEEVFRTNKDPVIRGAADNKSYLDLCKANLLQLTKAGIPEQNIELAGVCTGHHRNRFYSYRIEKGQTGRFGVGIVLR
jgi:YfiH family protein